jgi:hypothetical protein
LHRILNVLPVGITANQMRRSVKKDLRYPRKNIRGGCCGKSCHGGRIDTTDDVSEFQIRRPEGIPPLGDAMRLVDGNMRNLAGGNPVQKSACRQNFRVSDDQPGRFCSVTPLKFPELVIALFRALCAAENDRVKPAFLQSPQLVSHES